MHVLPPLPQAQLLAVPFPTPAMERLAAELTAAGGPQERSRLLLGYARHLPPLPDAARTDANRVMGCTAQVGVRVPGQQHGRWIGGYGWAARMGRHPPQSTLPNATCARWRAGPQVWLTAELDGEGRVRLAADSDAELTRGLAALLVEGLSGLTPAELLQVRR